MEDTNPNAYADSDDHGDSNNSNGSYGSYDTKDSMFNEVHPCYTDIAHSPRVRVARLSRASTPGMSLEMPGGPRATTLTSAGLSALGHGYYLLEALPTLPG